MRRIIQMADAATDVMLILFVVLVISFGIYGVWDNQNVYRNADASVYEIYRPSLQEVDGKNGLEELQKKNPDVIAWIQIDDTRIQYPVVQGEDNTEYINTDAAGEDSLSGSIFLDYRNRADFSDLNNIIYGHHMANDNMFGQLDEYQNKNFFETHRTGSLYYEGVWHPIWFFAFLKTDAYDKVVYDPWLSRSGTTENFCLYLRKNAQYLEMPSVSRTTRFVTLSTCSAERTNGRYVLIGIME